MAAFQSSIEHLMNLSPHVWLITGGTNTGVMKLVGKAFKNVMLMRLPDTQGMSMACIGLAPWGMVRDRDKLCRTKETKFIHKIDSHLDESTTKDDKEPVSLDPNHTHFLLIDDGTCSYGADVALRSKLIDHIACGFEPSIETVRSTSWKTEQSQLTAHLAKAKVPVVGILLEGGPNSLKTVRESVVVDTPFIIVQGSGRAADVIASAVKLWKDFCVLSGQEETSNTSPSSNETIYNLEKTKGGEMQEKAPALGKQASHLPQFKMSHECDLIDLLVIHQVSPGSEEAKRLLEPLYEILQHHDSVFVFETKPCQGNSHVNIVNEELANKILEAIQSNNEFCQVVPAESNIDTNGRLASKKVLSALHLAFKWNLVETAKELLIQNASSLSKDIIYELFQEAYTLNRVELVQFFLDNHINIFSKKDHGAEYCCGPNLKSKLNFFPVGFAVRELDSELLRNNSFAPLILLETLRKGYNHDRMTLLLLEHSRYPIALCLLASTFFRIAKPGRDFTSSHFTNSPRSAAGQARAADGFEKLAIDILTRCYAISAIRARFLLLEEIHLFGGTSVLQLAFRGNCKEFIGSQACQDLFGFIWNGDEGKLHLIEILCLLIPGCGCRLKTDYFHHPDFEFLHQIPKNQARGNNEHIDEGEPPIDGGVPFILNENFKDLNRDLTQLRAVGIHVAVPSEPPTFDHFRYLYEIPRTKFYFSIIAYLIFLVVFAQLLLQPLKYFVRTHFNSYEIVVMIFWANFLCQELIQLMIGNASGYCEKIGDHFSSTWNVLDAVIGTSIIVTFALRINAMSDKDEFDSHPAFYVKVGYSVVFGLFAIRILELFSASPVMGPKLEMIRRMLTDLLFFMSILMVFVLAYGILAVSLLQPMLVICRNETMINAYESYRWGKVFSRPYWSLMGELGTELDAINGIKNTDEGGICKVFHDWLFPGLLAMYLLVSSILLLNLLIAMFSQTFSRIHDKSEQIWAFHRYELILEYR